MHLTLKIFKQNCPQTFVRQCNWATELTVIELAIQNKYLKFRRVFRGTAPPLRSQMRLLVRSGVVGLKGVDLEKVKDCGACSRAAHCAGLPWQAFLHGCTLYSVVGLEPGTGRPEAGRDEASLGLANTTSAGYQHKGLFQRQTPLHALRHLAPSNSLQAIPLLSVTAFNW